MSSKWNTSGILTWGDGDILFAADLNDSMQASQVMIGGIIPWAKSITGVPSLPASYVECDGAVLSDANSPLDGETMPDLNSTQRFLRGAATSGTTGGSDTKDLQHNHSSPTGAPSATKTVNGTGASIVPTHDHTHTISNDLSTTEDILPAFYQAVMTIRVK